MLRRRKLIFSEPGQRAKARSAKWTVSGDGVDILHGRDPEVMWSLLEQLKPRRAVLSWLTPGKPLFGLLYPFEGLPWLTIVDDLEPAAAGPDSFDGYSLEWWATRAGPIAIDAATPTVPLYKMLGSLAADGLLVLIVQTVEERRLPWHQYVRSVRPAGARTFMMHHLKNTRGEGPKQILRTGELDEDFVSDRPFLTSSISLRSRPVMNGGPMSANCTVAKRRR
jgi:hypothetical protein